MKWYSLMVLFCLTLTSCAPQVSLTRLDNIKRGPNTGEIRVFQSLDEIKENYQEIALLETADERNARRNEQEMMTILYEAAKGIGAQGIVIIKKDMLTSTTRHPTGDGYIVYHFPHVKAAAIIFLN